MSNNQVKVLDQHQGDKYILYNGDSTEVLKGMPDSSIHLSVTSIPFAGMYVYNKSSRDVGNNRDSAELNEHLKYIMEQVHRVTMDGRLCCIHLAQEPIFKWQAGYIARVDFRGDVIRMMQELGWIYWSEVSIWKCPQLKAVRTKTSTLSQAGTHKDMTKAAPCMLDYVVIFKKLGENPIPVPALISPKYDKHDGWLTMDNWIEYASGLWSFENEDDLKPIPDEAWLDISESDVLRLGGKQAHIQGKGEKDVKHLCPLQNGVVRRLIDLYSNPNEKVLDMFSGQGTVPYWAVVKGRYGVGIELKDSYFKLSKRVMEMAKTKSMTFDFINEM